MKIKEYKEYDEQMILDLYRSVGWVNYTENPKMLKEAYRNSLYKIGAFEDGKLVGVLRAVGDGFSSVLIQDILVFPDYQRQGIGTRLMKEALNKFKNVYQIQLLTDDTEKTAAFYESLGFEKVSKFGGLSYMKMNIRAFS